MKKLPLIILFFLQTFVAILAVYSIVSTVFLGKTERIPLVIAVIFLFLAPISAYKTMKIIISPKIYEATRRDNIKRGSENKRNNTKKNYRR